MTQHIFRVVVRGMFSDLGPDCRERLLAEAESHDIFVSAYTAAGTFTYERRLEAFSFRFEVREVAEDDPPAEIESRALARAEHAAVEYLTEHGIGFKRLRSTATDMADMWRRTGTR